MPETVDLGKTKIRVNYCGFLKEIELKYFYFIHSSTLDIHVYGSI